MTDFDFGVDYLTIIADRKHKEVLSKLLFEFGCRLINVVYAKGSVQSGYFKDMLGLVPEEKKILITCIVKGDLTKQIFDQLIEKYNFNKPNTGIAFSIPVDKLSV